MAQPKIRRLTKEELGPEAARIYGEDMKNVQHQDLKAASTPGWAPGEGPKTTEQPVPTQSEPTTNAELPPEESIAGPIPHPEPVAPVALEPSSSIHARLKDLEILISAEQKDERTLTENLVSFLEKRGAVVGFEGIFALGKVRKANIKVRSRRLVSLNLQKGKLRNELIDAIRREASEEFGAKNGISIDRWDIDGYQMDLWVN